MLGANSDREQAGWSQVFKFWDSDVSEPEYYKQEQKLGFWKRLPNAAALGLHTALVVQGHRIWLAELSKCLLDTHC